MEVILLERIAKLGQMGDVVRVKDGFARNFLLPSGKALRATEANRSKFELDEVAASGQEPGDQVRSREDRPEARRPELPDHPAGLRTRGSSTARSRRAISPAS